MRYAIFSKANIERSDLSYSRLVETNFCGTTLANSRIYGISVWNIFTDEFTNQKDLAITRQTEQDIQIDNIEVAQFVYLILNNNKIKNIIDTITSKVVLILGRFLEERKKILELIKNELRKRDYLPIIFDFDRPISRNTQETILTLASMSKFIIADITFPSCSPFELGTIVRELRSVPIVPLLLKGEKPWGMWDSIEGLQWVLDIFIIVIVRN